MTYDLIIIGGGPGGLTAGLYGARAKLKTLLIEKGLPGGAIVTTDLVENYPGFPDGINGFELGLYMRNQAEKFGLEIVNEEILTTELKGQLKKVVTRENEYSGKAVIIATGAKPNLLKVPGEKEFAGRGVSYCATCDGAFFKDDRVVVIGGGDTAVEEALFLTRYASKVTIIHRRDSFRATKVLQERAFNEPKISILWNSVVDEINGTDKVASVTVRNLTTHETSKLPAEGVFAFVGNSPETSLLEDQLDCNEAGYIIAGETTETNLPGVFAVGDVRTKALRQVVTAVADGAVAVKFAEKYLEEGIGE